MNSSGVVSSATHPVLKRTTELYEDSDVPQENLNLVEERQENITFGDTAPAAPVAIREVEDPTRGLRDDMVAHLGAYLSRPVLINSYTWTSSSAGLNQNVFFPWHLFFSDTHIQSKLNNFARIRCDLKLKFVLNASPFYYGLLKVNYDPLVSGRSSDAHIITSSQFPGVWIAPAEMSSVELKLPFFWPRDYIDICSREDFETMGTINYNIFDSLKSANGVASSRITISCYAWAENVHLSAPTSRNAMQGPIGVGAGLLSSAAGALTKVPGLRRGAQAISDVAGTISDVATAFGFSNEPVMDDVTAVQVKTFHAFANTEQSVPLDKLSLDPKNSISMDPSTAGLGDVDELAVSEFCGHESYLGSYTWSTAGASGDHMMSFFVHPNIQHKVTGTGVSTFYMAPMRYAARHFRYWRGSIVYRIKIVATQYHKGRLQISWDPEDDASGSSDTETTTLTKIVDLDAEREIEFVVPYKAVRAWNSTNAGSTAETPVKYGQGAFGSVPNKAEHNGCVSMFIQNQLSAPVDPSTVNIFVFARAGPDFEFAAPLDNNRRYTVNALQGPPGFDGKPIPEEKDVPAFTVGERISSLRQLVHRTTLYGTFPRIVTYNQDTPTGLTVWASESSFPRAPAAYGYDERTGYHIAFGVNAMSTQLGANVVYETPANLIMNCYAGYRGSFNWHACPLLIGADDNPVMSISRYAGPYAQKTGAYGATGVFPRCMVQTTTDTTFPLRVSLALTTTAVTDAGRVNVTANGSSGISVGNSKVQPFVSVNLPQYNPVRFGAAWEKQRDSIGSDVVYDGFRVGSVQHCIATNNRYYNLYTSAGADFNVFYFICAPPLYEYAVKSV